MASKDCETQMWTAVFFKKKVPKQQLPNVHAYDSEEDDSIHFTIEHESDHETNTELKVLTARFCELEQLQSILSQELFTFETEGRKIEASGWKIALDCYDESSKTLKTYPFGSNDFIQENIPLGAKIWKNLSFQANINKDILEVVAENLIKLLHQLYLIEKKESVHFEYMIDGTKQSQIFRCSSSESFEEIGSLRFSASSRNYDPWLTLHGCKPARKKIEFVKSKEYQISGTDFHAVAAFACMEAEEVMVETASVVVFLPFSALGFPMLCSTNKKDRYFDSLVKDFVERLKLLGNRIRKLSNDLSCSSFALERTAVRQAENPDSYSDIVVVILSIQPDQPLRSLDSRLLSGPFETRQLWREHLITWLAKKLFRITPKALKKVRATSHDQIIRAISRSFSDILINAKDPEFRKKCLDIIEAETAEEFEKNIAGMTRNFMENRSNTSVKCPIENNEEIKMIDFNALHSHRTSDEKTPTCQNAANDSAFAVSCLSYTDANTKSFPNETMESAINTAANQYSSVTGISKNICGAKAKNQMLQSKAISQDFQSTDEHFELFASVNSKNFLRETFSTMSNESLQTVSSPRKKYFVMFSSTKSKDCTSNHFQNPNSSSSSHSDSFSPGNTCNRRLQTNDVKSRIESPARKKTAAFSKASSNDKSPARSSIAETNNIVRIIKTKLELQNASKGIVKDHSQSGMKITGSSRNEGVVLPRMGNALNNSTSSTAAPMLVEQQKVSVPNDANNRKAGSGQGMKAPAFIPKMTNRPKDRQFRVGQGSLHQDVPSKAVVKARNSATIEAAVFDQNASIDQGFRAASQIVPHKMVPKKKHHTRAVPETEPVISNQRTVVRQGFHTAERRQRPLTLTSTSLVSRNATQPNAPNRNVNQKIKIGQSLQAAAGIGSRTTPSSLKAVKKSEENGVQTTISGNITGDNSMERNKELVKTGAHRQKSNTVHEGNNSARSRGTDVLSAATSISKPIKCLMRTTQSAHTDGVILPRLHASSLTSVAPKRQTLQKTDDDTQLKRRKTLANTKDCRSKSFLIPASTRTVISQQYFTDSIGVSSAVLPNSLAGENYQTNLTKGDVKDEDDKESSKAAFVNQSNTEDINIGSAVKKEFAETSQINDTTSNNHIYSSKKSTDCSSMRSPASVKDLSFQSPLLGDCHALCDYMMNVNEDFSQLLQEEELMLINEKFDGAKTCNNSSDHKQSDSQLLGKENKENLDESPLHSTYQMMPKFSTGISKYVDASSPMSINRKQHSELQGRSLEYKSNDLEYHSLPSGIASNEIGAGSHFKRTEHGTSAGVSRFSSPLNNQDVMTFCPTTALAERPIIATTIYGSRNIAAASFLHHSPSMPAIHCSPIYRCYSGTRGQHTKITSPAFGVSSEFSNSLSYPVSQTKRAMPGIPQFFTESQTKYRSPVALSSISCNLSQNGYLATQAVPKNQQFPNDFTAKPSTPSPQRPITIQNKDFNMEVLQEKRRLESLVQNNTDDPSKHDAVNDLSVELASIEPTTFEATLNHSQLENDSSFNSLAAADIMASPSITNRAISSSYTPPQALLETDLSMDTENDWFMNPGTDENWEDSQKDVVMANSHLEQASSGDLQETPRSFDDVFSSLAKFTSDKF